MKDDDQPDGRSLVDALADELSWWMNWGARGRSYAFPRRSFREARRAGVDLLREVDPRRVGETRRSGGSSSRLRGDRSTEALGVFGAEPPEPKSSGGSPPTPAPACRRCGRVGHVAQRDSVEPFHPAGRNCRIAIGQESGELSPPAKTYEPPTLKKLGNAADIIGGKERP